MRLTILCSQNFSAPVSGQSLKEISESLSNHQFHGLVYSDPNGKQDFPITEIKSAFQSPKMQKVDLLMNVATTYVKRWETNPKTTWKAYTLKEIVNGHGKEYVFVRKPENSSLKWTFIYATNWAKQKNLNKINLYGISSDLGERIVEHIFNPKSNPLPGMYDDGSVSIQGKLDL